MARYKFPFVECDHHKGPQRSYVVCSHVMKDGDKVDAVELATDYAPGYILCQRDHHDCRPDVFCLICEGCAIRKGFLIKE